MSKKPDTLTTAQAEAPARKADITAEEKLEFLAGAMDRSRAYVTLLRLALEAATQHEQKSMNYHLGALVQVARDIEQEALEQHIFLTTETTTRLVH